ncbi:aldo/keto reductase [Hymenobacter sp. ASUV-10]|uniref:Aldo/keto reductase n=1 Tax=Hymenobacter aranciens TaxID=3063996 RepID=A0ABT9B6M0_9BACT|nr:aldo/keto reductase [Hymenobacter sp. ASUV-10]MDO7873843.1 aldo/keto reductase [Hymenobacter sp. ASUV-10]
MQTSPTFPATFKLGGDLAINRLGFGAMRITGPQIWGPPEDRPAMLALLRRAVELGVNFIDTADMYGPFTSEELIGEALAPYPTDVVVGTKGGLVRFGPWADFLNDATPQHLHDALDGSLRRLHLERIDLYQLHRIDPRLPAEKSFEFLAEAQRQGRVRHLGLSEVTVDEIKHAQQYFTVASVQNRYSLFEREAEPVLDYCREQGIAFIPWFPIGGGQEIGQSGLQRVADRHQASERQVALSWLLHHAPNILLIPGTSSIGHLEENMRAAELRLTAEDMQELDAVSQ